VTRDDVLKLRDQLYISLMVREGTILDSQCATERSNNVLSWLEAEIDDIVKAALVEAARGCVVTGAIEAKGGDQQKAKPLPFGRVARHLEDLPPMTDDDWNDPRIK